MGKTHGDDCCARVEGIARSTPRRHAHGKTGPSHALETSNLFAGVTPPIFDKLALSESRQRLDGFEAGRMAAGNPMAQIVYPKDTRCDFISPDEIKTHKNRGVAFRPKAPDPGGMWRNE
jgi:hypothetical protein